ncbi:uncharacterized protein LOC133831821 [Humulus lupulus]|uniref:uncharacterized protein LOC133831821 n=1 Tax=Humulus lupulus TaxID=3486 RepID=UPI002B40203E|nr:uncharacterized protein LOC133831821 [Humulus lupulus]
MDVDVDHYIILGLPTGQYGAKLTEKEITKAYKVKALLLHPDKNPDDPKANAKFQRLKSSFDILKDDKARKLYDEQLRRKMDSELARKEEEAKAAEAKAKAAAEAPSSQVLLFQLQLLLLEIQLLQLQLKLLLLHLHFHTSEKQN